MTQREGATSTGSAVVGSAVTGSEPHPAGATDHDPLRGRQAEARRNDRAILEAARDLVALHGPDVTVAGIAARAGVGMGSLYRRYGTKTELLQALCVLAMRQAYAVAQEAVRAADPWDGLVSYIRAGIDMRSGALASLAGAIPVTLEMTATARFGQGLLDTIVDRAHQAGSLRVDVTTTDVLWLVEQFSRRPIPGVDEAEADRVRSRLLGIALDGLRAPAATPLPGRAPSARAYRRRWDA